MKVTTSLIPTLVFYTCYEDCTISEAILHALKGAKNNTLTLTDIGDMKVNWNRLLGSYSDAIRILRNQGYNIENKVSHDFKKNITKSLYTLKNKDFSPTESDLFNTI